MRFPLALRLSLSALTWALAWAAPRAAAHPHVWVDAAATLRFRDHKIVEIDQTWLFDELFSQTALEGAPDLAALVKQSAASLKDYSYFTFLQIDGKRRRVGAVKDFIAQVKDKRLIYQFVVPVDPPVDPAKQDFSFLLYDETFYVDIGLVEGQKVLLAGDAPAACTESRREDKTTPLYFNSFYPTLIRISCR